MFEVAIGNDGLKDFCIDSPTAATELMDEQRRDRAEFKIGGVEVGARLRHRRLAFGSPWESPHLRLRYRCSSGRTAARRSAPETALASIAAGDRTTLPWPMIESRAQTGHRRRMTSTPLSAQSVSSLCGEAQSGIKRIVAIEGSAPALTRQDLSRKRSPSS